MLSEPLAQRFSFDAKLHDPNLPIKMSIRNVNFWYGQKQALQNVNLDLYDREITSFIGPSGCGKSTLLKCLNRMHDHIREARMTGTIKLGEQDIYEASLDPPLIRRRFGWVAQKPDPFPRSIYENVAYGPRLHGMISDRERMRSHVKDCLEQAGLWEEVADRLDKNALELSGGQQQRLCIARALSTKPDVLLMDEPCSAIDPIATERIEKLLHRLGKTRSIVLITHNLGQAARLSQRTAFFKLGELLEAGETRQLFRAPEHPETLKYVSGVFG